MADRRKNLSGKSARPVADDRWHEFANIFPGIEGDQFGELVEDIRKNGILEPVIMYQGRVLDGRNRVKAAEKLGINFPSIEYAGEDPLGFVIAKNLKRRHLTESQRAMVAARLANLQHGQRADRVEGSIDLSTAAKMLNVSKPSIKRAKQVQRNAVPEIQSAVESGEVSVSTAAEVATLPPAEQSEIVAKGDMAILAVLGVIAGMFASICSGGL